MFRASGIPREEGSYNELRLRATSVEQLQEEDRVHNSEEVNRSATALKFIISTPIFMFCCWLVLLDGAFSQNKPKAFVYPEDVQNLVFPPMRVNLDQVYAQRLMLRFTDPWMEIVIERRVNGDNVTVYTVESMAKLNQLFARANRSNGGISASDIAHQTTVKRTQIIVSSSNVDNWFRELEAMRLSPKLEDIVCLHDCPQFDLWYDTRQDSAHYSVLYAASIPPQLSPQATVAGWMLKVRSQLETISSHSVQ